MNNPPEAYMQNLPQGVMLNAYPDSMGSRLADTVALLKRPELKDAFSLFYILPTFFNSDLDRGFSIIDYDINEELVSPAGSGGTERARRHSETRHGAQSPVRALAAVPGSATKG